MIIGKKSFVKGGLLFVGVAVIDACIVATFATGILILQIVAGIALIAVTTLGRMVYKSLEK